jgi:hypothetical protein
VVEPSKHETLSKPQYCQKKKKTYQEKRKPLYVETKVELKKIREQTMISSVSEECQKHRVQPDRSNFYCSDTQEDNYTYNN